ncbi:probable carboxylesterase 17 [Arachis stenosperma]|uniref:probable carboxylesterase 17 n=1 Tax=Arachis stenosperma TaxID=217475 RepID=UPI0025AD1918|nr:probable carboxylesterase 17 [Arachis stenosperma]
MAAISLRHNTQVNNNAQLQRDVITEEIEGLIRVRRDGRVERPPIVPNVSPAVTPERGVTARDIMIHKETHLWARIYLPLQSYQCNNKLPLLVYFHGGGFCVGSAAWSCYHEFLINLAAKANCVIVSIDYKLAPENRLPAAYDDGTSVLNWVKREALNPSSVQNWWLSHCNINSMFLGGDSAGANIAFNVATRMGPSSTNMSLKGVILIQPFFGGEERTLSEKNSHQQPPNSALTLPVSDTYWRLALPIGSSRDHPYCNPLANGTTRLRELRLPSIMVCVSELDILRDRNLEFSTTLARAGKRVETVMYKGVGHAFQVLHNYQLSHSRTQEMISHIRAFLINQ